MQSSNAVCLMQRALAAAPAPVSAPPAPAQAPAPEPNAAQAPAPAPFALAAPLAALINPKKGAGLMNFGNVNAALGDARLAWTYNWWYSLVGAQLQILLPQSSQMPQGPPQSQSQRIQHNMGAITISLGNS